MSRESHLIRDQQSLHQYVRERFGVETDMPAYKEEFGKYKLFLSIEPLLAWIDLRLYDLDDNRRNERIDWVIVGGEREFSK